MISLITTCKNRLSFLKKTIPRMHQQTSTEVIVVDYGCQEGTYDWVRENYPATRLVRVADDPRFSLSRARNIGVKNASGRFLLFIDADVVIENDLSAWAMQHAQEDRFYIIPDRGKYDLCGALLCSRDDFNRVGGYDEVFRGWGEEDNDLYERFASAGLSQDSLPDNSLVAIEHGDDIRMLGEQDPAGYTNKKQALALGRLYRMIKLDLQRLFMRPLAFEERELIFSQIKAENDKAIAAGKRNFLLVLDIPPESERNRFVECNRALHYRGVAVP